MDFFDPESDEYLNCLGNFSQLYGKRDEIARNRDLNPDNIIQLDELF
jgi:hypothetical protein